MTVPSALGVLHGTGLLFVGLGLAAKAAFSYGGWRWWKARLARRLVTDLALPKPLLTERERRP